MKQPIFTLGLGITLLLVLLTHAWLVQAQEPQPDVGLAPQAIIGTAFTYQGQLKSGGSPLNGNCDFQFSLYDAVNGGTQVGATQTKTNVSVSNGLFTTQIDFGSGAFNGDARWLQIAVRCPASSGSYTTLSPRQALTPAPYALALPGLWTQQNATTPNVIGGYSGNTVTSGVKGATISGGGANENINRVTDDYGTVGGGYYNRAGDFDEITWDSPYATIGGGYGNLAASLHATVGGGRINQALGQSATIGGGWTNTASNNYTTVCGGFNNTASGYSATIVGGYENIAAGDYSVVAGRRAKNNSVNHGGVFLYADNQNYDFPSTSANQFRVRSTGGAQFVLGINSSGSPTWTCSVSYGNSWSCSSDRNLKENMIRLDGSNVLAQLSTMPIYSWSAKGGDPAVRHIGPMAQDFYHTFGLGQDDKTISTIDLDGVALASIQGLYQILQEKEAEIATLKAQNAAQQAQMDALQARLMALEERVGGAPAHASALPLYGSALGGLLLLGVVGYQRRQAGR